MEKDFEQENALLGLDIGSIKLISQFTERQICIKCHRKRMYFCYDCRIYVSSVGDFAPKVQLPVKIDIIKHQLERNGKSTATHCLLLAPNSTQIFDKFDQVPNYAVELENSNLNTVVVYPSKNAISIDEFVSRQGPIDRFIFLDATWWTVKRLCNLPQLKGVPTVSLKTYKTRYWRPQKGFSDEFLATIEAIYYAVCENFVASEKYNKTVNNFMNTIDDTTKINSVSNKSINSYHKFDNLLFWFFFFRSMVEPEKRKKNR